MSENQKELSFEEAINNLEELVDKLESNEVSLEEGIELFKQGMVLSNLCSKKLKSFEEQIYTLTEIDGEVSERKIEFKEENE